MTATPHSHTPDDVGPGATRSHRPRPDDLDEELCRVQADMLQMGRDNYQRLRRVCPDPQHRYRVLRRRLDRQIQLALAASVPRWRAPSQRNYDAAATSTAAREVWFELGARGQSLRETHIAMGARDGDGFSPGQPPDAERCWCCDTRGAASDIGLCEPCHTALTST